MLLHILKFIYLSCFITCIASSGVAQTSVPFDSDAWEINSPAYLITEYQGQQALYMNTGRAILNGINIKNGIIEFDIAFSGQRGFTGAFWRMVDGRNYEDFYMRPHQSGQPDANQYTPVFNGRSGWQLYHGDGYSAPTEYPLNQWIPVKIVFWEDQGKIYIDDMENPAISIAKFKREPVAGGMGIRASVAPVYFSNFSYTELREPPFERIVSAEKEVLEHLVKMWQVSAPFPEKELEGITSLSSFSFNRKKLGWQALESEENGITNLARLHGTSGDTNTVFVRMDVNSDRKQVKKLLFGYSDRVKVFVNGQLVYGGDNSYQSRDFRYLGTIGLFDELYMPLERGENEVRFAVTEGFGGWGIFARFENFERVSLPGE